VRWSSEGFRPRLARVRVDRPCVCPAKPRGPAGTDARPYLGSVDQVCGGWVGTGVDHLLNDVLRIDRLDDRCRVGGPEILKTAKFGMFLHFNVGTSTGQVWASPNQNPHQKPAAFGSSWRMA